MSTRKNVKNNATESVRNPARQMSADEHDELIDAHADLLAASVLPTPPMLHERTGISLDVCGAWVDGGREWHA